MRGGLAKSCAATSAPRGAVGGRGEGDDGHAAERLAGAGEQAVFGAEVVAPLRDAVGLVDGEAADAGAPEARGEGLVADALGRDVEEAERAVVEQAPGLVAPKIVGRRIERRRGDAEARASARPGRA